jgi:hypothetical protein
MKILVDADHCPADIRQILIKAALKRQIRTFFISNKPLPLPKAGPIALVVVEPGKDVADKKILEMAASQDLAITADIPLAARLVEHGVTVIHPKGDLFNQKTMGERLASYQLTQQLREQGIDVSQYKAPARFKQNQLKQFADTFDRELTIRLKDVESKA